MLLAGAFVYFDALGSILALNVVSDVGYEAARGREGEHGGPPG